MGNMDDDVDPSNRSKKSVTFGNGHAAAGSISTSVTRAGLHRQKTESDLKRMIEEKIDMHLVIVPWNKYYKMFWGLTVLLSYLTAFFTTYQVAFLPAGIVPTDPSDIFEYCFLVIFVTDIVINFNLGYYDEVDELIIDRKLIARHYLKFMFWIDLIGIFPFNAIALACAGLIGKDTQTSRYLSILQLFRLIRLHRVRELIHKLQYSSKVSLMWLTLIRNFGYGFLWSHFAACCLFFISRQSGHDEENTWIGGDIPNLNVAQQYVTSLYWSVTTFATVGYGDYSPVNTAEQIFGIIYMLLNMIIVSWIIGSITLLIVKDDERIGHYRDALYVLGQYSDLHSFDDSFRKRLKTQLKLDFHNRDVADEQVLQFFPSNLRRKALRLLYMRSLYQTKLMKGLRQQFVDAFLIACRVEIFSPGDDILQAGNISSDLYLIVEGSVKLLSTSSDDQSVNSNSPIDVNGSVSDSEYQGDRGGRPKRMGPGDFINDIEFFCETPQTATVQTVTICKMLTMSKEAYKQITEDHPASVGKILQNILARVEEDLNDNDEPEDGFPRHIDFRKSSDGDTSVRSSHDDEVDRTIASAQKDAARTSVQDLIKAHISKLKDDHTTRFLYAAARDFATTISYMCNQGFDPNESDYDSRTALMVAAMKGNTAVVKVLLEYEANPNQVDMHGSSALYEAAKNGHEATMVLLLSHGAKLCMDEGKAASTMCQAVFDGDNLTLKRLLKAGIQVNAGDYDKRTAVHIAAAEGNVAALKVLVEFGADLTVRDRWNNTVVDEAKRTGALHVMEFLKEAGAENV